MARPLGRAIILASVLVLLACFLVTIEVTVGPGGVAPAGAQTTDECLPPPTLIYGEIAQVAGTNSPLWADVQAVEQADEAAGTEGSGQVIQDMLAVINRDGYQWDCATDQLEADVAAVPVSPGIPTIPDTPAGATTTTPATPAGAATTVGPPAATSPVTPATHAGPPAGAATVGNTGLANSAPVGVGQSTNGAPSGQVASPLALAAGTNSSSTSGTGELSTVALGLLALVTAALLVLVVRWQMGRR